MKKFLFFYVVVFVVLLLMAVPGVVQAQRLRVYNGTTLVATYYQGNGNRFVFDDYNPESLTRYGFVDLGLPSGTLWASCNIGASNPEESGYYFAWGETEPQVSKSYSISSYKLCNGSTSSLTKYCTSSTCGTVDNKTVLEADDDAAHAVLASDWRMPSLAQMVELRNYCSIKSETMNDVAGFRLTSKFNGKSIFLPAAGYYASGEQTQNGSGLYYWTNALYADDCIYSYAINGRTNDAVLKGNPTNRSVGMPVRPVFVPEEEL